MINKNLRHRQEKLGWNTGDVKKENRDISEDLNPTWGFEESMGCDQCDQHELTRMEFWLSSTWKKVTRKSRNKRHRVTRNASRHNGKIWSRKRWIGCVWNWVYHPFRQFDEEKDDRGYPIFGQPNLMKGQNQKASRNISAPDRVIWRLEPSTCTRKQPKHWRTRHLQMVPSVVFGASPMIGAPKVGQVWQAAIAFCSSQCGTDHEVWGAGQNYVGCSIGDAAPPQSVNLCQFNPQKKRDKRGNDENLLELGVPGYLPSWSSPSTYLSRLSLAVSGGLWFPLLELSLTERICSHPPGSASFAIWWKWEVSKR